MMKPLLSNEFSMSFGSQFNTLTSRDGVQTVGSAARPWTNVAAFARLSAMVNGSGRVADAKDSLTKGGVLVVSSMRGAENEVTTVLTSWSKGGSTPDVIDNGDGSFRVQLPAGAGTFLSTPLTLTDDDYSLAMEFRQTPGESSAGELSIQARNIGEVGLFYEGAPTTEWQLITGTDNTLSAADALYFLDIGGAIDFEIRAVRLVKSAIPHAAPPVGSIVNYTYATDQLSQASVVYTGDDFIVIAFMPYGWDDVDNPANATPIIFEAGALQVTLDASGFYTTNGGAVSTKKPVANTLSVMYLHFDGGNHTISVDNETPVVNASAIVPTGTTYGGNLAAGTEPAHAILVPFVGPGSESATNITLWNTELQSRLGGIVTQ